MRLLDLIDRYWKLFLDHEPTKYSRMNGVQARHKYTDVLDWNGDRRPLLICPQDIADHLDGCRTYAVPLIGASGLSNKGAIELDHGGIKECRYVLAIAAQLGYHGFAITSGNPIQGHDGGHLWFLFDDDTHPDRILAAMELIRDIAVLPTATKLYPNHKKLRLPAGVHRWTGQRGTFLASEVTIDLTPGLGAIAQMLDVIDALPRNLVAALPPLPDTPRATDAEGQDQPRPHGGGGSITHYNQTTDLLAWLEKCGGTVASARGGRITMHCPCNHHRNQDAHPSLEIREAREPQKYGTYIAIGHSPKCLFHTERKQVMTAFEAYCRWHGRTARDALEELYPQPLSDSTAAPLPTDRPPATRSSDEEAPTPPTSITQSRTPCPPTADTALLTKGCRHVLAALQEHATAVGDYLRGNAYLAQHLDLSIRTIRRHLRCLELRGLIEAQPRYGQTTIYRVHSSGHTAGEDCASCPLSTDGICSHDDNQPETCVSVIASEPGRGGQLSALDDRWACDEPETHVSVLKSDDHTGRGGHLSATWIYQTRIQEDADQACEPAPSSSAPDLVAQAPATLPERHVSGRSEIDELLYGPAGALAYPDGAAYVPPGVPDAEAWYTTQVQPSLACQPLSGADTLPEQLVIQNTSPVMPPPAPERRTPSIGRARAAYQARLTRMKATELAGELIKWRRTEAKRGPAAWLSARIRDVEAEIDAREEPADLSPPAPIGPKAHDIKDMQCLIDDAANALQFPPSMLDANLVLDRSAQPAAVVLSGIAPGVPTPAHRAGSHAVLVGDSDPWVRLQRWLLAQAEQRGDSARAAFYRAVLAGDPLPGTSHQPRRAR